MPGILFRGCLITAAYACECLNILVKVIKQETADDVIRIKKCEIHQDAKENAKQY